ncbi:MAG: hypothetical protein Q9210_006733 [Variospora velana]
MKLLILPLYFAATASAWALDFFDQNTFDCKLTGENGGVLYLGQDPSPCIEVGKPVEGIDCQFIWQRDTTNCTDTMQPVGASFSVELGSSEDFTFPKQYYCSVFPGQPGRGGPRDGPDTACAGGSKEVYQSKPRDGCVKTAGMFDLAAGEVAYVQCDRELCNGCNVLNP